MTLPISAVQLILELEALVEEHGDMPVHIRFRGHQQPMVSVFSEETANERHVVLSEDGEPE